MKKNHLAGKMTLSMVLGIACGVMFLLLRQHLTSTNQTELWNLIHQLLFQDITAPEGTQAIGLFYVIGQLFVNSLQLVIVPMVFTSIVIAMCRISDTKKLGRISFKTIGIFMMTTCVGLLFAGIVGMFVYHLGAFNVNVEGLSASTGTTGSNPLNIFLQIIPNNIMTVFSTNGRVLSIVFIAVCVGLAINQIGKESTLKKLCEEVNEIITVFLSFIVNKFGPIAIFCLLSRTFAIYGINHLLPAMAYVITVALALLVYLCVGYPLYIKFLGKMNPIPFVKKIVKVAVFAFSTSSSAAALPMNLKTTTEELGVHEDIASFVLPLGMTINMDGTAIMQVIASVFIAGCAGYEITFVNILVIGILALVASIGTPAAPGAGAVILFTILSGMGYTSDAALMAYSLILAINRPIEMLVTSLNVVGDGSTALIVANSENALNTELYHKDVQ
ncbi:MAG: dicarboxylate/amino acid:cation symporter [Erysipelotrichaceae bacterium]|nr:dicarboxylate/amino acid:cation symporter [Erysipelotrichaceae bacterium]